jgi:hypothetical protein
MNDFSNKIDKGDRDDGTFSRSDFLWDKARGH